MVGKAVVAHTASESALNLEVSDHLWSVPSLQKSSDETKHLGTCCQRLISAFGFG